MEPVEIRGDGIASARVVAELRARATGRPRADLPPGELDLPPPLPTDRAARLDAWLDRARRVAQRLSVDPQVGWHTPVLGPLWNVVRRLLYRDLRLYADAVASKQMVYNDALIQAVELLVERVATLENRIAAEHGTLAERMERLVALVEGLESRLAALERKAGEPAEGGPGTAP